MLTVELNQSALPPEDRAALGEIRVHQRLSLPSQCELTFYNQPSSGTLAMLSPGTPLRVRAGDAPVLFSGEVTAVEYVYDSDLGRRVRVRGYDVLHRLRKRQPVRTHVQAALVDIVRELAGSIGLAVEAPLVNLTWRRLIQQRQTDLDFLSHLTAVAGLYFTVRDRTLHLLSLEGIGEPIPLSFGESLIEARVEINSDSVCSTVSTDGWDPLRAETHEGRASRARVGRAIGEAVSPASGTGDFTFVHQAVQDNSHAEAISQAELDLRVAREVVLRGTAEGDPRLQPGARVALDGVAPSLKGRYVLTEVTHVLGSQSGYVSEISTYPEAALPRPESTSLVIGKVTSIDDPDSLGRVQVSLPACNGVESDWMGVVTIGAGAKKGLVMLPDVGDTVLVLCPHQDPAQGVILGGLYGIGGPPEGCLETKSVQRFSCQTPGGQRLRFDDNARSIRLENKDGSYIELGPDKAVYHAATDLEIAAPGKTITVRGMAINFEQS